MDEKREFKQVTEIKVKQTKEELLQKRRKMELKVITTYAQVAVHTLQNTNKEINAKTITDEIKFLYTRFANDDIEKFANSLMKEKKEKKEKKEIKEDD